ncbi:hypothetical protein E1265_09535 [Streptomyces sp. 8K308]|uniref:hypothetical protein n=1 Tax=Streptomyces sp. 8K308 TaxID=2530388 RepID=UPI00104974B4|nr:hypothetical protein [Streptomyces sp. 8K308]TDC24473.1 hypothetical protein E1265_09535 [Streptomyces sp. 8K308]
MTRRNYRTIASMARRAKAAVGTVVNSDQGRAACAAHVELFEQVEFAEGGASYARRLEAAAICDSCPLRAGCGFRIIASRQQPKRGR